MVIKRSTTGKKEHLRVRLLIAIALLTVIMESAGADWSVSSDPLAVRLQPAHNATVIQNPPGFSWVSHSNDAGYEISLRSPMGYAKLFHSDRNWYLPASRLPPGEYFWKVRPKGTAGNWSPERLFRVSGAAHVFEVPEVEQLLVSIRTRLHPRSLTPSQESPRAWLDRIREQNFLAVETLERQTRSYATTPLVDESAVFLVPREQSETAWVKSITNIRQRTQAESRQIRAAAVLWRLTGNSFFLNEATKRGDALAALDPDGSTSHAAQDQGNRAVAWALTLAYDYLADDLPDSKKAQWLSAIRLRTAAIYGDLQARGWRLANRPLDSHGSTNIGYVAAISAILIDRIPEAEGWFRNTFRFYIHFQSPWGDEDGGFGNGSAYAEYSTWYFVDTWDAIAATTAVNLYAKPWSKGMLRFLACFVPPGSATHAFGDAAETNPVATTLKAFSNRVAGQLAYWYARNLVGTEDALSTLTNPLPAANGTQDIQTIDRESCLFESIGWVAMHSNLADRSRTSLYFKSSRFGSYNHSHADQNSFTLSRGGRPLLIDSGWYDYYGSPLSTEWYRHTRAHNAITFDNGIGQIINGDVASLNAKGKITAFNTTPRVDYVAGDATPAYGGALTSAVRHMWYLRGQDAVLIWDKLESASERVFEWNMHAAAPITSDGNGAITIVNREQQLCITQLLDDDIQFQRRTAMATKPGVVEDHAAFVLPIAKKSGEFLVLLDIGCKRPKVSIDMQINSKSIYIGSMKIDLDNPARAEVEAPR